ncbi:MAG: DNA methyltransferase [Roseovarius sp.]|nr:DNA methyltransferase [Roseovarius sp.]
MAAPKRKIDPVTDTVNIAVANVFSNLRTVKTPEIALSKKLKLNTRLKMDGLDFLSQIPEDSISVAFFDPQYRGILDKMKYGNEGKSRGRERCELPQMTEDTIREFAKGIDRILIPSGHLFLWIDKFHLCQGFESWFAETNMDVVDMITWNKKKMGMGYRTRRCAEYLIVLQTLPRKAKGVWKIHNICDVWDEPLAKRNGHAHRKPVDLQSELISAVSNEGDVIVDPAAGSFSVMEAAKNSRRNFLGCDING